MRAFRFLNLGILAALLASSAVLYAQDEKQQEDKPKQEEPKRQEEPNRQAKPESKQDDMKAPRQEEAKPAKPEQDRRQEEAQPRGDMRQGQQPQQNDRHEAAQPEPGRQQTAQQPAEQQGHGRPAGRSGHIPDDRFRAQFGRGHTFVAQRPQVVNGQPQFVYGGYTFVMVDAWPADWSYSDDCYIDYVDGDYFLYDLVHPGMRIALFVIL